MQILGLWLLDLTDKAQGQMQVFRCCPAGIGQTVLKPVQGLLVLLGQFDADKQTHHGSDFKGRGLGSAGGSPRSRPVPHCSA